MVQNNNDVTIVTAFFDIGRSDWIGYRNGRLMHPEFKRTTETYFQRFERLTKLKNPIVCYTESRFFDKIKSMRSDVILISIDNLFDLQKSLRDRIAQIQKSNDFISLIQNPECPEYWSPEYVIINAMKSFFVCDAIEKGFCKSKSTAWIDFGYLRDDSQYTPNDYWTFDTKEKINLFANVQDINLLWSYSIVKTIATNQVFIRGCHIVAPNNMWTILSKMIDESIACLLKVDLIDDDQTYLLMAYRSNPNSFIVHPARSSNWFDIFDKK